MQIVKKDFTSFAGSPICHDFSSKGVTQERFTVKPYPCPQMGLGMLDNYFNIALWDMLKSLDEEETNISDLFDSDCDSLTKQVLRESGRGEGVLS